MRLKQHPRAFSHSDTGLLSLRSQGLHGILHLHLRNMAYSQRGYPRLAALMGKEKDVAIFRRFDDLNMLCLLSLQAEIVQLETEFKIECIADDTSGLRPALEYSGNFKLARNNTSAQHTKLKTIRELIREYSEC